MTAHKKVGILLEFNFEDAEAIYPFFRFQEAGFTSVLIAPWKDIMYKGKHGYPLKADMSIDEVKPEDLVALIIPGGFAPDIWRRDKRFLDLVKGVYNLVNTSPEPQGRVKVNIRSIDVLALSVPEADYDGRPVAAICHGPWMFCSAKILRGKRATCFVAMKDDLENAGATYEDAPVVVDGNMITSRTPKDLPEFCKAILAQLA